MQAIREVGADRIEILPVVVVMRAFPARPAAVPDIREFIRQHLAQSPLSGEDIRALGQRVADTLLESAGTGGTIQVLLRIFADHAEVDVLQASPEEMFGSVDPVAATASLDRGSAPDRTFAITAGPQVDRTTRSGVTFADWLAEALRRDGLTMEAAARQLQVSVKTVSRWVRGTTEPRLCDLSRIREVFGDLHFL